MTNPISKFHQFVLTMSDILVVTKVLTISTDFPNSRLFTTETLDRTNTLVDALDTLIVPSEEMTMVESAVLLDMLSTIRQRLSSPIFEEFII